MVRLLREFDTTQDHNLLCFQSHNGAIAARKVVNAFISDLNSFNPTMVRLLLENSAKTHRNANFQSHNGAIAAGLKLPSAPSSMLTFNPTMVRLLRFGRLHEQFWDGFLSIPQWCDCCGQVTFLNLTSTITFNPTMVRLLLRLWLRLPSRHLLSIPQWCDCCRKVQERLETLDELSIPQWCDCCVLIAGDFPAVGCCFQSHNGAIAASSPTMLTCCWEILSIPQWCDCCIRITT